MSEPKRYERCYHKDYIQEGMEEKYNGKWVSYADYARLKAEVERLRKANDEMGCFVNPIKVAQYLPMGNHEGKQS